jgi:hypothetical protein
MWYPDVVEWAARRLGTSAAVAYYRVLVERQIGSLAPRNSLFHDHAVQMVHYDLDDLDDLVLE